MSENNLIVVKTRCERGTGSARKEQKRLKVQGKAYKTRTNKTIPAKLVPKDEVHCKCSYKCKKLKHERKLELFHKFYAMDMSNHGTQLMGLMNLGKIQRRRHGTYESPADSRR